MIVVCVMVSLPWWSGTVITTEGFESLVSLIQLVGSLLLIAIGLSFFRTILAERSARSGN